MNAWIWLLIAIVSASSSVKSSLYSSFKLVCAPSLPLPMDFARHFVFVPLGSTWYNVYPPTSFPLSSSSNPATNKATPNGRLMLFSPSPPKDIANRHSVWHKLSTGMGSLNVK